MYLLNDETDDIPSARFGTVYEPEPNLKERSPKLYDFISSVFDLLLMVDLSVRSSLSFW